MQSICDLLYEKKRINKSDLSFLQKLKKDIFSKVPLPLSGYVETHSDRGKGTGPLPLSGCVSTYPDRGRGTGPGPLPEKI